MILKHWLKKNKIQLKELAELMGVSISIVNKISSGDRRCSIGNALRIERATGGEVSREEALWPDDFIDKNEDGSEQARFEIRRYLNNEKSTEEDEVIKIKTKESYE
jgi:DNA-binding transcriptional regulator YdaS (Cro superfamily)